MRHRTLGLQANTISGAPESRLQLQILLPFLIAMHLSCAMSCVVSCAVSLFLRSEQSSLPKNILLSTKIGYAYPVSVAYHPMTHHLFLLHLHHVFIVSSSS